MGDEPTNDDNAIAAVSSQAEESTGAVQLERNRPTLRLIDGKGLVDMVLEHYGELSPRYRSLLPLKQIYVPDLRKS